MFQKVFEYAGPHKKGLYAATAIVLVSVLMGVLTFGNLVYEGTTINFNPLMAMAADLVVADVGSICEIGSFAPEQVGTPGIFVDYVLQGYPMNHVWDR